ncbi:MAG: GNAT family N-acetyltransferase [Paracoccaceae bacterium]
MTDVITTQRLVLRRPVPGDAAVLARVINDLDVSRWLTRVPFPYGQSDAEAYIDRQMQGGGNAFFIFCGESLAGCVGTERELGYWVGRSFWGKGFATEAAAAAATRHFSMGAELLHSGHFVENTASRNVLNKLGFVPDAMTKATSPATGEEHALQKMLLTRDRWEALQ